MGLNVEAIREDFPFFKQDKKYIYFDNACMSLKPKQVIDAVIDYYSKYPGCGGRSVHQISTKVSDKMENSRKEISKFFNTKKKEEIIFTKNTTESLNLVANSLGLTESDTVLTTDKEHNSNLLPWQVGKNKHVVLHSLPDNTFDLDNFEKVLAANDAKLVSLVHTSNLDGISIPLKEIVQKAHEHGALVMVDAAQSAPHKEIDVRKLDLDFLACSGHKMLGPTATGVLYGKKELLEKMKPFIVGGETVIDTTYTDHNLEDIPHKFEAGLQHYAGIIGLGEAVKYLKKIGLENIQKHENELNKIVTEELGGHPKIKLIGPKEPTQRSGIFSFVPQGITPHSVSLMLDSGYNIQTRSGAHCVHSWFNKHNLQGSARASFYLYNTEEECRVLIEAIKRILQ